MRFSQLGMCKMELGMYRKVKSKQDINEELFAIGMLATLMRCSLQLVMEWSKPLPVMLGNAPCKSIGTSQVMMDKGKPISLH